MTYLIDTNVVSELAKKRRNSGVLDWLASTDPDGHHISVLSIGELRRGIERVRRRGDLSQVASLEEALQKIRAQFAKRVIPITLDVTDAWSRFPVDRPLPVVDALIGATASTRGWTVVTRNVRDFEPLGVPTVNPFTEDQP